MRLPFPIGVQIFSGNRNLSASEATSDLVVLSFDGKGIAMRHDDRREATRKAAKTAPRTLHSRFPSSAL